ncbi:beta-phosphoglucomutase [Pseudogracilibacillus sp. SO30301A]|uniref:beta-phosphoglucomutase n=1 Tax=Pseudogracilibacillus sp. SO30301A TaxID=3098291 RepID=UPI00300E6990
MVADDPKVFIFDLDGVITDTSEFHYLAWKKLASEIGIQIDRNFNEQLKGIGRIESLNRILELDQTNKQRTADELEALATRKNMHYQELINSLGSANILPGIETLLKEIRANNIKIALGSSSRNAKAVLEQLGLIQYFDYLVDAAKVTKGKPNPETFTTAADYFNIPYDQCVGIEDAASGVEALNQAAMFSVGVGDVAYLGEADYVVRDTSQLNFSEIIRKYQQWMAV